jgi:osmotically-inducible protein OsmY
MDLMTRRTDDRIRRDVLDELAWESRLAGSHIDAAVDHGVVTLSGSVDSYATKLAAQEAARCVLGVTDVANELEVKVPEKHARTDTEVARAVRHVLEWDVMVPENRIQSTVSEGWVALEGTVDRYREREDAEAAVRPLVGVRGVSNRIVVAPPKVAAHDVCRTIEEVLARRAHREASAIGVHVRDGVVTLEGQVRSWAEKQAILGAVAHARGIQSVNDQIRINPYD